MQPKYKITLNKRNTPKRSVSSNTEISHIKLSLDSRRGKINIFNLTFANTLYVTRVPQTLLMSRKSFTTSGSIYKSTNSLFFLPMVRQETALNTSNARPLRAKNRSCAMLDIFLSASYTPSSCSIFPIGGRVWCTLNQKVVFHGLPGVIRQDSLGAARLTHDWAAVGPTFQNYHQSSIGTRPQVCWIKVYSLEGSLRCFFKPFGSKNTHLPSLCLEQ